MPIYEYVCRKCGHQFEALILPKSDSPSCPECRGTKLERMISHFAFSTENTRKSNIAKARKDYAPLRKEKQVEQAKYEERVRKEEYGG
jgi:putative FmdB family regulatory protein